jgi:hypothetical protein
MKNLISFTFTLILTSFIVSCDPIGNESTENNLYYPHKMGEEQSKLVESTSTSTQTSTSSEGSIAPAITIHSITFLIDGQKLVMSAGDDLPAPPGSEVSIMEVEIYVGTFLTNGGEACVDFAPINKSGEEIRSEHMGTHMVPLSPGLITIPGLNHSWIIDENWVGITAVVNHWPGVKTEDLECAQGQCERDHRVIIFLR